MSSVNGSGDSQDGQSSMTAPMSHTAQESSLASTAGPSQSSTGPKTAMTWAERLAGPSPTQRGNAAARAQAASSTSTRTALTAGDISQPLSNMHLDSWAVDARQGRPDQPVPDTNAALESASAAKGRTHTATDSGWGDSSENGSKKETADSSSSGTASGAGAGQSIPATTTGPSQAAASPEPAPKASPAPPKPNIWQVRRQEAEKKLAEQAAQRKKDASVQPPPAPADPVSAHQPEGTTAAKKKTKGQKKKESPLEKGGPTSGALSVEQSSPASWPSPLEERARGEQRESQERESRERQREDSTAQSASSTGTSSPNVEKRKPSWKSIQPEISFTSALPSRQSATGATGQRNGSRSPRQVKAPYSNKNGEGSSSPSGVAKASARAKSAPGSAPMATSASRDGLAADPVPSATTTSEPQAQTQEVATALNALQEGAAVRRDASQNAPTASTEHFSQNQPASHPGQVRAQRGPYPMGPNFQSPEISSRMQQAGLPAKPDWTARSASGASSPAPRPRLAPAGQSHQSSSSASIGSATSQSYTGQSTSSSTPFPDASGPLSTGTETAPSSDISATAPGTSHAQHSHSHGSYQQGPYFNQRGRRGMPGMGSRGGRGGFAQNGRNMSTSRGTDGQYQGNGQYYGHQQGYASNSYQSQPYRWNSPPQSAPFSLPPQDPRHQGLHQQQPDYPEPVALMPPYQQPYYPQAHMQPLPGAFYPPPPSSDFGSPASQHQMLPNTGFGMPGYAPTPGPSMNSMQARQQPPPPPFAFERPAPLYDYSGYPFPNDGGTAFFVLGQIEFYFSSDSLARDSWMRQRMDAEGWIDIALIAAFKRLKMLTSDLDLVKEMMNVSYMCEVRENKVRTRDWQRWILPGAAAPSWTTIAQPPSQTPDDRQKQSQQDERTALGQQPDLVPVASTGTPVKPAEPVSSA